MKYVLILEDNRRAREALAEAVRGISRNVKVLEAENEEEAKQYLFDYQISVFVLDIILTTRVPGDVSGIRFAEKVRRTEGYLFTPIIFVTALADPAMYAYRNLHSFCYLEKPFSMKEAVELITVALRHPAAERKKCVEYFRKDGILIAVDLKKVTYAQACRHTLIIHMGDEKLDIPYITIRQFLKHCQADGFLQCSRNAVVNRNYIRSIDLPRRYIQLKNGEQVEIGPVFAERLRPGRVNFEKTHPRGGQTKKEHKKR